MELTNYRNRKFYQCNLPQMLKRAKMRQVELAHAVGMNPKSFHRIVHGRNIPMSDMACKIAAVLKTTRQDIWPGYDEIMAQRSEMYKMYVKGSSEETSVNSEASPKRKMAAPKKDKSAYHELWKYRTRSDVLINDSGQVIPVTLEDRERDLVLSARHVPYEKIEDDGWCRRMADMLHKWILNNSVWGVYRHLRAAMYAEHKQALEREERAAMQEAI